MNISDINAVTNLLTTEQTVCLKQKYLPRII